MALTLEAEQRLQSASLTTFFEAHRAVWLLDARETYEFLRRNFPDGVTIRPDDVAKPLRPIIEVNERLKAELASKKLRQKYWILDFVDLIVDRTWIETSGEEK
jgi:hypothetical protein